MSVPAVGAIVHERREILTEMDAKRAAELCGAPDADTLAPAFVLALRTAIESNVLPGGAIMLSHQAQWLVPLRPAEYRTTMRVREAGAPRTRYQRVVIGYTTHDASGRIVLEQSQEVLWPITS